jgi:uncharacterized membrane protein
MFLSFCGIVYKLGLLARDMSKRKVILGIGLIVLGFGLMFFSFGIGLVFVMAGVTGVIFGRSDSHADDSK